MSHYVTVATKFTDPDALVAALCEVKNRNGGFWARDQVEVHQEGSPLCGYQGDYRTLDGNGHTRDAGKAMRGHIVVRRCHVGGGANDLGFARQADGTYSAIVSGYDSGFYGQSWQSEVAKRYGVNVSKRTVEKRGYTVEEEALADGRVKLHCNRAW